MTPPLSLGECGRCGYRFFPPQDYGCERCGAPAPSVAVPAEGVVEALAARAEVRIAEVRVAGVLVQAPVGEGVAVGDAVRGRADGDRFVFDRGES